MKRTWHGRILKLKLLSKFLSLISAQPAATNEFCSALAGFSPPSLAPADLETEDQALLLLAARCWAGNMQACDDLSAQAAAGSPEQSYGQTCAGRQDEGSSTPCTEEFSAWTLMRICRFCVTWGLTVRTIPV